MARLPVNGASDHTDSPLTVEGKGLASPISLLHAELAIAIEEGLRRLRITPGVASAIIQALVNISTTSISDATASSLANMTTEGDIPSNASDPIPSEGPTAAATSPVLTPAVTAAPVCVRDAVSASSAHGILTPVIKPTAVEATVAVGPIDAPTVVLTTGAPIATRVVNPTADVPVAVPAAAVPAATPGVAPAVTMATAGPTVTVATPIVAAPASTTAPAIAYHLPAAGAPGPYYCVTRGRDIGVFSGW